jgi:DNA repair exonuclease SbcCD ATPase subunit
MLSPALETRMTLLLEVLDEDIRHLERTLSRLDTLRSLLIKREDAALQQLLEEVRRQAEAYQANEQKRQQLRRELAAALGCAQGDLTLTRLQRALADTSHPEPPCWQDALADRQARLRSLAAQLKREYTLTVLLVRDCLRFNRSLMQIFFGIGGRGQATYSPTGAPRPESGAALMSMKL